VLLIMWADNWQMSRPSDTPAVDDQRLGTALRLVRRRRGWAQAELALRAGCSQGLVSMLERGHLETVSLRALRRVAAVLDIRIDVRARWRAGDLDRLLNARHSELHELVARWFAAELPEWVLAPEVSFAIYGERGVIDVLAWHEPSRSLLVPAPMAAPSSAGSLGSAPAPSRPRSGRNRRSSPPTTARMPCPGRTGPRRGRCRRPSTRHGSSRSARTSTSRGAF